MSITGEGGRYGLNGCAPSSDPYIEALPSNAMVLESGPLGGIIRIR